MRDCARKNINNEIRASYKEIQTFVAETSSKIIPCTQAHNRKCSTKNIADEKELIQPISGFQALDFHYQMYMSYVI